MKKRLIGRSFGIVTFLAAFLGLLALIVMVATTALQAGKLTAMHATAQAGLSLSLRTVTVEGPQGMEFVPYIVAAQVDRGSNAAMIGVGRGDAILFVNGQHVPRPAELWDLIRNLPGGREIVVTLGWIPKVERVFGILQAVPDPSRPGKLKIQISSISENAAGAKAGLKPGDLLLSVGGIPITGTRQAWEALVVAVRHGPGPVELRVGRGDETVELQLEALLFGELSLERDPWKAWRAFLTRIGDPRYPERSGLASAFLGSLLVVGVMAIFAFPLGIGAAVYLEEYAKKNWFSEVMEILVANLAGIPSAVVGIFGLEIFARAFGLGRSVFAGGLTLALLLLPMTTVAARAALRTVPQWVRESAFALGATQWQVLWHHVLPYAFPGIVTGIILAMARALGEAAPLLLLGAFLYLTYVPKSLMDGFTVVPLQIFDWATKPQDGFTEIAAAAILVLIGLHLVLNALAIWVRNRYQRRWA